MIYYSYNQFQIDTNKLILQINNLKIHSVLGIARGGLTLAHTLAEGLNLRDVQTLRTELYDEKTKREKIKIFESCSFTPNQTILVVDDIADSGETLETVMLHLKKKFPQNNFISATLFYKKTSIYQPNIWVNEATQWIEFFWEKDFQQKVV